VNTHAWPPFVQKARQVVRAQWPYRVAAAVELDFDAVDRVPIRPMLDDALQLFDLLDHQLPGGASVAIGNLDAPATTGLPFGMEVFFSRVVHLRLEQAH
jgi:hypothetical protein